MLNGKWLISMGVNDMKSAWLELPHKSLLERMRPVEDVTGQIFQSSIPNLSSGLEKNQAICLVEKSDRMGSVIDSTAQTTLEKRRAALVKARAARAAKRQSVLSEKDAVEYLKENGYREVKRGDVDAIRVNDSTAINPPQRSIRKRRRRRRTKAQMAEARAKALAEYEAKKSVATEEVKV